jgi:putative methionine-R-sulfoxide reductase with GAF domain
MHGSAGPEDRFPPATTEDAMTEANQTSTAGANRDHFRAQSREQSGDQPTSNASRNLGETELDSALQLLVERAQYITGATGTALALPQGEEMVCRASAGASAPAVGARLQVRSGLTGESISRRQLLRCDNAENDPRVNLEACRALGIASIVVLPLLRRDGEVRGLFELFSDHPYAFEERDLIALERMADLTLTALDLAEQRPASAAAPALKREPEKTVESPTTSSARLVAANPLQPESADPVVLPAGLPVNPQPPASIPEAMLRGQKCSSCGFPVSEGRTLCLDCEKKASEKKDNERDFETRQREKSQSQIKRDQIEHQEIKQRDQEQDSSSTSTAASALPVLEEPVPAFLANYATAKEPWLTNPINLLAIVVLILGILVTIVVFR